MADRPIGEMLPHSGSALLVVGVKSRAEGGLVCAGRVPPDNPFVMGGRAPAFVALEMAAQAAAVLQALEEKRDDPPRIGYLVGVRDTRLRVDDLPVGESLRIRVRPAGVAPPLRTYDVEVTTEMGTEVLRGTISTYVPDAE